MMMTERGMAAPAVGGRVLADYDTILVAVVPELAGRVQTVAFDAEISHLVSPVCRCFSPPPGGDVPERRSDRTHGVRWSASLWRGA